MKLNNNMTAFQAMSMACITLGIILFAVQLQYNLSNNILLFTGLFLIIAGIIGYVYSLCGMKKKNVLSRLSCKFRRNHVDE